MDDLGRPLGSVERALALRRERDNAFCEREQRVIPPGSHVVAGKEARAPLAKQDLAYAGGLSCEELDAQVLGPGVPQVLCCTGCLCC